MNIELPLVKLEFTFKAEQDILLPYYAGSAFRGVFGSSLRKISCLSGKDNCHACSLMKTCPYAVIFESQEGLAGRTVNPYIIEPTLRENRLIKAGEEFSFTQILFGDCIKSLSFVLLAWSKGMQFGMGKNRSKATLISVIQKHTHGDRYIYGFDEDEIQPVNPIHVVEVPETADELRIKIQTPLRIHREKHPIKPDDLTIGDFTASLLRRIELLYAGHTQTPSFMTDKAELLKQAKLLVEEKRELKWQDWTRWSGRQQTHIALGGVVGEWCFKGDLTNLLPIYYAGEVLHLGKSTVMGLGKYVIF